ncbi:hypothetical protein CEXT_184051 [Caerostris extrusa]|uniref:Uncharacterized protein n=1 Tax=Caerostris extrusa TaxID=172846 RepID=A0AAV4UAU1_CAEEX|nr:hypothetical protein CEXT_184051 [Caerostris extrusa]
MSSLASSDPTPASRNGAYVTSPLHPRDYRVTSGGHPSGEASRRSAFSRKRYHVARGFSGKFNGIRFFFFLLGLLFRLLRLHQMWRIFIPRIVMIDNN